MVSSAASRCWLLPVDIRIVTPPWMAAMIAAAVRAASIAGAIWPDRCITVIPAFTALCHCWMSRPVMAWAAGECRPNSVIKVPSGQCTPWCRYRWTSVSRHDRHAAQESSCPR
jgi:hypothetical protein